MCCSPARAERPRHVAVIMDGNGRWAARKGSERAAGHRAGARAVRSIVRAARELGLGYLTLFALSTENLKRPQAELRVLMHLLVGYLDGESEALCRNRIELRVMGDVERLPARVRRGLSRAVTATRGLDGMRLTLAVAYGGRDEIVRALRRLAPAMATGRVRPEAVDEAIVSRHLDSAGTPDPDLVIRTGGEYRLSNFLLWQAAYAELYVTDVAWPDFRKPDLEEALRWYESRQRRFGGLAEASSAAESQRRSQREAAAAPAIGPSVQPG